MEATLLVKGAVANPEVSPDGAWSPSSTARALVLRVFWPTEPTSAP